MADEATDHGIEAATYSGGSGEPYFQPSMICTCGWSIRDETWEMVGAKFDEHLKGAEE